MQNKWLTYLLILLIILMGGTIFSSLLGFIYADKVLAKYPTKEDILSSFDQTSYIYDINGQVVKTLQGDINRKVVPLQSIPPVVQQAFVAVEDVRFYQHHGVDFIGIARAAVSNFRSGEVSQGGSTITQQVMKRTFLSSEKTVTRKVKEIFLALYAERLFSKDEILEIYLNSVYFGEGAYGIQSASEVYFDKSPDQLNLEEGALLAGLLQAPSYYDPVINPDLALQRRNDVLAAMQRAGYIAPLQVAQLSEVPLSLSPRRAFSQQSYILDYITGEANRLLGEEMLLRGVKIHTTYDPAKQARVDEIIQSYPFPDQVVQTAMVVLEHHTGAIQAMVGGRNYSGSIPFNRATQMTRQPGSSFKPITVYAPAFEKGYTPNSIVEDSPLTIGNYSPQNSGGGYYGRISIRQAVKWSRNVAAVWLLNEIGVHNGFAMAQKLNFQLPQSDETLAIALGGITRGVTPLQMAGAYGAFANRGLYQEPYIIETIEDAQGSILYKHKSKGKQVMQPSTAEYITSVLETAVNGGTGTRARVPGISVAGKTGTTELPNTPQYRGLSGNKDNWFCGYTPQYAAAVWVGYDEKDMNRQRYLRTYGGDLSADIFSKVMTSLSRTPDHNGGRFNYTQEESTRVVEPEPQEENPEGMVEDAEKRYYDYDAYLRDQLQQKEEGAGVPEGTLETDTPAESSGDPARSENNLPETLPPSPVQPPQGQPESTESAGVHNTTN